MKDYKNKFWFFLAKKKIKYLEIYCQTENLSQDSMTDFIYDKDIFKAF